MLERFRIDANKEFKFEFAKQRDDQLYRRWLKSAKLGSNPNVIDSAELATLAFRRWREALAKKRVANCIQDVVDFIRDNPHSEVSVLVLIKAPWLRNKKPVGLCHVRRTWCNNIYIDFLTVHPAVLAIPRRKVPGVGTALLYFVSCLAKEINAETIWGEATQNSVEFYRKLFNKPSTKDLIFLERRDYAEFIDRVEGDSSANPIPNERSVEGHAN
jgi:hypothetical protein